MKKNFNDCLRLVLKDEGGYTNDPKDPGGPTNYGITIFDYRKYINPKGNADDVKKMTVDQAKKIYKEKYWDALGCDSLPSGIDYTCFDYGVNSGLGRPRADLKRYGDKSGHALIDAINDERLSFLQKLKTFPHFGKGWTRRVSGVRAYSHQLFTRDSNSPVATTGGAAATAGASVALSQYWHAHQNEILIIGFGLAFIVGTLIYYLRGK